MRKHSSVDEDDRLCGDAQNDKLNDNKGADILIGGRGALIGGRGADRFRLSKGKDTIKDFSIGDGDIIDASNMENLQHIQRGDHLQLRDNVHNIKTILLNINQVDLLLHQPELI